MEMSQAVRSSSADENFRLLQMLNDIQWAICTQFQLWLGDVAIAILINGLENAWQWLRNPFLVISNDIQKNQIDWVESWIPQSCRFDAVKIHVA